MTRVEVRGPTVTQALVHVLAHGQSFELRICALIQLALLCCVRVPAICVIYDNTGATLAGSLRNANISHFSLDHLVAGIDSAHRLDPG